MRVSCGNIYVDLTWSKGSTTINYSGTPGSYGNYWRIKTAGSSGWNGYKAANGADGYGNSSGSGTFTQSSQSQNYVLQWYSSGGWTGTYQESFTINTSTASDGSGGGSTTPSYDYKSNTISFSQASYNLPSYGGTIKYTRSTTGTGKAPVLWINSEEIATLGDKITSSNGTVNESFETSDYSSYFNTGDNTVELKVAQHTSGNTITSAASTSATINIGTKPSSPTINQTIVSSSTDRSYVTADKITSEQGTTIYCSLDGETEWFQYLAGTYAFETDKIYYFKSNNGIEDSDIVDKAPVVSNSVASISITKVTYTQLKSSSLLSNATYARKVKPTATANFVEYKWYFRTSTTGTFSASSPYYLITSSSQNSAELTIDDTNLKRGFYYQIGVVGIDNYNDATNDGTPTWYTNRTFQITPTPQITSVLNYFEGTNFDTSLAESNRFYTDLTFYFTYDSEVTKNNIKVQYRVEGAQSWSPEIPNEDEIVLGSTTTSPYLKIKLPATLSSDKKYEFQLSFITGKNTTVSNIKELWQINKNNIINNLSIYGNQSVFKPYTETGDLQLQIAKPYQTSFKEVYTKRESFQCQIIISNKIILLDMINKQQEETNIVYFFFNKTNLYTKLQSLNLDKTKAYQATLKLAVTNVFGIPYSQSKTITIDYRESPEITFNRPKRTNGNNITASSILKENDKIVFQYTVSDYNPEKIKSCIQINRSDSDEIPNGQWVDYTEEQSHTLSGGTYLTPSTTSLITQQVTISEITQAKYIYFRVRITDSSGNQYSDHYMCGRSLRHTAPVIQALNTSYKENLDNARVTSGIEGQLSLIDLGVGLKEVEPSQYLINENSSKIEFQATYNEDGTGMTPISSTSISFKQLLENYNLGKTTPFSFGLTFDPDKNYINISLKVTTIVNHTYNDGNSTITQTKTFSLPPFVVFNTLQTISYRKNRLAINTRDFDTNEAYQRAILVLGQADATKNEIIYSAPTGQSGHLINFVIDCGSWD